MSYTINLSLDLKKVLGKLKKKDLRWFSTQFLNVVISVLADYGVTGYLKDGEPGVWVDGRKICSFGIALKKWVSSMGA